MRKKLVAGLLAGVMALSLAACGGSASEEAAVPETETATEANAEEEEEKAEEESTEAADTSETGKKKIGFAESTFVGDWRVAEVEDIKAKAEEYGYELVMTNAENDMEKEIADVEDLIAQNCDLIVIVPVDAEAVKPAFDACKEAGIPVIDMDTQYTSGTWGEDFITTVRSDQYAQGQAAAEWVIETYGTEEEVTVLEITGTMGQSDAQNRHNGFADYMADYSNINIVTQSGDWDATLAQNVVQNVCQTTDIDVVYTHSDGMAPGAVLGLKQLGLKPTEEIGVVTVDCSYATLDSIIAGEITAAITCTPRGGDLLFSTIDKYFAGESLEETYFVPMRTVTVDIAEEVYDEEGF